MQNDKISFAVFEAASVRLERTIKRLWILAIILIVLLFGSNAFWIYYESQFETIKTEIEAEQDGDGVNIIGGGDVDYGAESKDKTD